MSPHTPLESRPASAPDIRRPYCELTDAAGTLEDVSHRSTDGLSSGDAANDQAQPTKAGPPDDPELTRRERRHVGNAPVPGDFYTARAHFSTESPQRTEFHLSRVWIVADQQKSTEKYLIIQTGDACREKIRLSRSFVYSVQNVAHGDLIRPDCVICIRDQQESGMLIACPSHEMSEMLKDRLCLAGCIMRDFAEHIRPLPQAEYGVRLVQPLSSRTATRNVLALKVATNEEKKEQLLTEAQFLLALHHPGIPRVYGMYEVNVKGARSLSMITDFAAGGDLEQWIPSCGFPEWVVVGVMEQICSSVEYLHNLSIVHRDLKPSNIFCEPAPDGSVRAVVADFGLAAHVGDLEEISRRCGSSGYVAPEMFHPRWCAALLESESFENLLKIDMFSFGALIFTVVVGKNPFHDPDKEVMYDNNARVQVPQDDWEMLSVDLQLLLDGLLVRRPSTRMSSVETSIQPWFCAFAGALAEMGVKDADRPVRSNSVPWEEFARFGRNRSLV